MSDRERTLAIIAGQSLVVFLKGDNRAIASFREGYVEHWHKLQGSQPEIDIVEETVAAGRTFAEILSRRYGWNSDAVEMLSRKIEDVLRPWLSGNDPAWPVSDLRVVDLWCGISSGVCATHPIPLSLLDYVVMTLLPIVCAKEVRKTAMELTAFMKERDNPTKAVDAALGECVKRLCCGIAMSKDLERELKLVVLLHMPKNEGILSANAGFAYKMLQRQFAKEEVK